MKKNAYDIVTEKIIDLLVAGTVPWRKPWAGGGELPKNLVSKRGYRGVNIFLLASMAYESPFWMTFNQARKLGGMVKKGEKACPVVFWKWLDFDDQKAGKSKRVPMLRYYHVFNASQCEGIDDKVPPVQIAERDIDPIDQAEQIINDMPRRPEITNGQARAFYRPDRDLVNVPRRQLFNSAEEYYSTLFHELVHSTGHESRLARHDSKDAVHFGSASYSKEELVAEMGSAYICNSCSIAEETINNSAAYIAGWLKRLKNDKTFVVKAASQAQKAVDFITDKNFQEGESS